MRAVRAFINVQLPSAAIFVQQIYLVNGIFYSPLHLRYLMKLCQEQGILINSSPTSTFLPIQ